MKKPIFLSFLALFSALWVISSFAQGSEEAELALAYGNPDTVEIATGHEMPIARAPAVASVVTAEEIKAMGATSLSQVLESVPGLHVSRVGGGFLPIFTIRGIDSQYNPEVLMLLNGIPMTSGFVGDRGRVWGNFPVEDIARIEVMRGPGSALYGADAVAGVINIITKTAADIAGTEAGVRAGSYNTYDAWIEHGGKWKGADVALYLGAGKTDGFGGTVTADAQTALDALFGTHASHAPGPIDVGNKSLDARIDLSKGKWRFRAGYRGRYGLGVGTGIADALDPQGRAQGHYLNSDLTWNDPDFAKDWSATAQLSYFDLAEKVNDLQLYPPGAFDGAFPDGMIGQPDHWERQTRLNFTATYSGFEKHKLRLGAGYHNDDLYRVTEWKNFTFAYVPGVGNVPMPLGALTQADATNGLLFLGPHARNSYYAYAQDEWSMMPDWYLTAGARYDHYSDFGGTLNPRLALVWDTTYDLTSKLMFGRAFRAPSFAELYNINNPVALGNPDLKPETIDTLEMAFSWQPTNDLNTGFNLFHYRMKNMIRFMPNADPSTGNTAQNAGGQHGSGLELEFNWEATSNLSLSGNYAYQRSVDETTGSDAGLAPHNQIYARADWRFASGWSMDGQLNWVADRIRQAGDNRPKIPNYTTVDLTLRTAKLLDGWEAALSVRNLFDANAREPTSGSGASNIPYDLPLPGRNYYLELRYSRP